MIYSKLCKQPSRAHRPGREGHTLIEVVVSVIATSILVAGMGSVVMVAARSTSEETLPIHQIQAAAAVHEILSDLQFALSLSERSATAVEFTVPDRDSDGTSETIRYAWSATEGDPLTRQYNGGDEVDFLANVHAFEYADLVKTVTDFDGNESHHVYECRISLQVGDNVAVQTIGATKMENVPEVAAP